MLIKTSPVSVNDTDEHGNTVMILCQNLPHSITITNILLSHNATVDHQNHAGETALMKAVEYQQLDNIIKLVNNGADMNMQDKNGNTALSLAKGLGLDTFLEILDCEIEGLIDEAVFLNHY